MPTTLVICIGNVARGDDGVGHRVAQLLSAPSGSGVAQHVPLGPGTVLLTAVGLDVAMAADVAQADELVIVDAERRDAPAVSVRELVPGTASHSGHAIDAPGLLAVTAALYGQAPPARLVSIAAPDMGHAEALSDVAEAASVEAASVIRDMLRGSS